MNSRGWSGRTGSVEDFPFDFDTLAMKVGGKMFAPAGLPLKMTLGRGVSNVFHVGRPRSPGMVCAFSL